ncbi:MAG: acyl-CoA synthetase, partial [Alphaproteobacteria bacterium]|nr:acyl-CoA synthetase [Alphaproteobacteria bacterium]
EIRGEIVKAYVILAPGYEGSDALSEEIQDFVKNITAPYKYPREIEYRTALPKTISGKIRRVELRAEAEAGG